MSTGEIAACMGVADAVDCLCSLSTCCVLWVLGLVLGRVREDRGDNGESGGNREGWVRVGRRLDADVSVA